MQSYTPLRRKTRLRVKRRGIPDAIRRAAWEKWGMLCVRCGRVATDLHHLLPRGRGGKDTVENLRPACRRCHDWLHRHPKALDHLRETAQGAD